MNEYNFMHEIKFYYPLLHLPFFKHWKANGRESMMHEIRLYLHFASVTHERGQ